MKQRADTQSIKERQRATWASGNYAVIGTTLQLVGEALVEACDFRWGDLVLDVAAGNGNASLAAARVGCRVTSTDYVRELLEQGAVRARAEGLDIFFRDADAEALPFDDGSFDGALSTFGVMFAPDQYKCASEIARVCRPSARIGLANWTPNGFVGQMLKLVGRYVPLPSGDQAPTLWGLEAHVRDLFAAEAAAIEFRHRQFKFRYESARHFVDVFRSCYGPVHRAFQVLDHTGSAALEANLLALLDRFNVATGKSLIVPGEYLEAVIVRR